MKANTTKASLNFETNKSVKTDKNSMEKGHVNDKSKFVLDILDYAVKKNADVLMRSKLLRLVSDEVGKVGGFDREVLTRLGKLEKQLENMEKSASPTNELSSILTFDDNLDQADKTPSNLSDTRMMHHNPLIISDYLKLFKENGDLKWTTHPWDEKKYATIEDFIQALNESKEYLNLFRHNRDLYNLIRYFIYKPKNELKDEIPKYGWPNLPNLKVGWQFPNDLLVEWCKINFDNKPEAEIKYPFSYPLPKELQPSSPVKGKIIRTFENVVDVFKTEIQFRENYFLTELKKRQNKLFDYQFIGIDNFKNLEFYTYTPGVLAAIDIMLNEIRKNETEKEIHFNYHIYDKLLTIDVVHINSYPFNRLLDLNNLAGFLGGGLNAIAENVFSICDFSIISKFSVSRNEEFVRELCITYEGTEGKPNGKNITIITPPMLKPYTGDAPGFTYRLKFPI